MKKLLTVLFAASVLAAPILATAATLKTCEGISTDRGYKYVGVYCVDFACTVTTTRMFDSWCPYQI